MLNQHRQPGLIASALAGGMPLRPEVNFDADRAPITFGWWLYAEDSFVGSYHLETLYRLDRVHARLGDHSGVTTLQPNQYHGQNAAALRELLRLRQHTLLPRAPAGHRWIGPQLIREAPCVIAQTTRGAAKLHASERDLPTDPKARLDFARSLASRILCERVGA